MREFVSNLLFVVIGIFGSLVVQITLSLEFQHQFIAACVMLVAIVALAALVWKNFRDQKSREGKSSGRLPVKDAGQLMYNKADKATREFATSMASEGISDPASYFVGAIFIEGTNGTVKIYGRRGPGLRHERIPPKELDDVHDVRDGKIVPLFKDGPEWMDPCISKSDALRVLQMYSAPKVKD